MVPISFKRSVKLFLLGLFLNTVYGAQLENVRVMGVLQRFGIAYGTIGTLYVLLHRTVQLDVLILPVNRFRRICADLECLWPLWLIMLGLVAVHSGFVYHMATPECPP